MFNFVRSVWTLIAGWAAAFVGWLNDQQVVTAIGSMVGIAALIHHVQAIYGRCVRARRRRADDRQGELPLDD